MLRGGSAFDVKHRDDETLDPKESRRRKADPGAEAVALEILFHADLRRVGDRVVLGDAADSALAESLALGRDTPVFNSGAGLADPCVSRHQVDLRWVRAVSRFAVEAAPDARRAVRLHGARGEALGAPPLDVAPGTLIALGDRVLLRLGVEPAGVRPLAGGLVGSSAALHALRQSCAAFALLEESVLISGAVGSGKERAARAIHELGPRASGPFVALNCAAVPEGIAESELFGHVKGAFSSAASSRTGLLEAAQGGTLFLDEVGELGLGTQAKLLRALQEKTVRPVGATHENEIDVRVLAATHRDLSAEVAAGRFRGDLLSRLSALELAVPPLAAHREDIPLLFTRALARIAERTPHAALESLFRPADDAPPALPLGVYLALLGRDYRHNVRELEGLAARVAAAALSGEALVPDLVGGSPLLKRGSSPDGPRPDATRLGFALAASDYSPKRAADVLGVSHSTVDRWMRELGLPRARDLSREVIEHALAESGGETEAAARALSVSERGLVLRMRELGIEPGPRS